MLNRFLKHDLGRDVLEKLDSLRIECHKLKDGKVWATFKLTGSVGDDPFDDGDQDSDDEAGGGVATAQRQADDLRFLRELLEQFQKPADH